MNTNNSINNLVKIISTITGEPIEIVKSRLLDELMGLGTNVTRDIARLGITPHVYGNELEKYYSENEAFLYELIVYHLGRQRQNWSKKFLSIANKYKENGNKKKCTVLCLGDGIGIDSLVMTLNGFEVTYFEFENKSYEFAKRLWQENEVIINVINDPNLIPEGVFDIVINSDVLEHVEEPEQIIKNIGKYTKDQGIVILIESFLAISPNLTTHLLNNVNHAGKILNYFDKENMIISEESENKGFPLVFRKIENKKIRKISKLKSYTNYNCLKVRINLLLNSLRGKKLIWSFKEKNIEKNYLDEVVGENKSYLLKFNKS